ncbi:hypothetical protein BH24ACI4_BH24ACI4_11410 [soil metagenome]
MSAVAPAAQLNGPGQSFEPLFDGHSLACWVEMGPSRAYTAADGVLRLEAPQNHPNWLRTEREFENFVLRLEYTRALRPACSLTPMGSPRAQRAFDRLDAALATFLAEVELAA